MSGNNHKPNGSKESTNPKYRKHIFVCANIRPITAAKPSCGRTGSADLRKKLKKRVKQYGLHDIRVSESGCLGQCEWGPNIVVYPDNVWYNHVSEDDFDEIIEQHLINGKPVKRLMTDWSQQPETVTSHN